MTPPAEMPRCSVDEKKSNAATQVSEKHGLVFPAVLVLNLKPREKTKK